MAQARRPIIATKNRPGESQEILNPGKIYLDRRHARCGCERLFCRTATDNAASYRCLSQANLKQLQGKDQMIQSQEGQLAQTRQQLNDTSNQLAEMKTKLDASQKELSLAKQRVSAAAQRADRPTASRAPVARRTASRATDTAGSLPAPAPARQTAAPGVYETTRATSVYENPSSAARIISQIGGGTRINVVSSAAGWLEVRSKRGNPPGYVRADDARVIGGTS